MLAENYRNFSENEELLKKFAKIVGFDYINNLIEESKPLYDKCVVHVNSTLYGGGVVEILNDLVIMMNELGIDTEWHQIKGSPEFFTTTKIIHNALQGAKKGLSGKRKRIYLEVNRRNSIFNHLEDTDCVIIHDPQPLPIIDFYQKRQPWIWRCHIDLSARQDRVWEFLQQFINKYDAMIVSMDDYKQVVDLPQEIIMPSINPFNDKNKELSEKRINHYLKKYGIERDKPLISQISRFDKWKDPIGVVNAFKLIKKKFDCKLVLLGNMAQDDPEGQKIYQELMRHVENEPDIIISTAESSLLVNTLQTISKVVIQKSIREGFALTVSEALWKGTPVVGGNVGGIPLQIIDGKTGYLVNNVEECADRVLKLLKNPDLAEKMGKAGKEHVRKNFLMTRHLMDYIKLLKRIAINYKV
ncbi:MAG: glycosyltransferase [Candidatus Hodarchaeota archaeon]